MTHHTVHVTKLHGWRPWHWSIRPFATPTLVLAHGRARTHHTATRRAERALERLERPYGQTWGVR